MMLLGSSTLAIPSQPASSSSYSNSLTKRQIMGTEGDNVDPIRPAEWDDLPPLPAALEQAYERNAEMLSLALLTTEMFSNTDASMVAEYLDAMMTYLSPDRVPEIFESATQLTADSVPEGDTAYTVLSARMRDLDLQALEQEMAEFVRFRTENESIGSPGQEAWRYPFLREEDEPLGRASPFHSLTESQDRLLIVAKVLSDRTLTQRQLLLYLLNQDPFLTGHGDKAFIFMQRTLRMYNL